LTTELPMYNFAIAIEYPKQKLQLSVLVRKHPMKILKTKFGLNLNETERRKHLEYLKALQNDEIHFSTFQFMYDNLNIIDSKSSALLTFNSLIIAVLAIWTSNISTGIFLYVYAFILILFLISSLLCLLTVFLHWSPSDQLKDIKKHIDLLLQVREQRTIKYRYAWYLAYLGILLMIIAKVFDVIV